VSDQDLNFRSDVGGGTHEYREGQEHTIYPYGNFWWRSALTDERTPGSTTRYWKAGIYRFKLLEGCPKQPSIVLHFDFPQRIDHIDLNIASGYRGAMSQVTVEINGEQEMVYPEFSGVG